MLECVHYRGFIFADVVVFPMTHYTAQFHENNRIFFWPSLLARYIAVRTVHEFRPFTHEFPEFSLNFEFVDFHYLHTRTLRKISLTSVRYIYIFFTYSRFYR